MREPANQVVTYTGLKLLGFRQVQATLNHGRRPWLLNCDQCVFCHCTSGQLDDNRPRNNDQRKEGKFALLDPRLVAQSDRLASPSSERSHDQPHG